MLGAPSSPPVLTAVAASTPHVTLRPTKRLQLWFGFYLVPWLIIIGVNIFAAIQTTYPNFKSDAPVSDGWVWLGWGLQWFAFILLSVQLIQLIHIKKTLFFHGNLLLSFFIATILALAVSAHSNTVFYQDVVKINSSMKIILIQIEWLLLFWYLLVLFATIYVTPILTKVPELAQLEKLSSMELLSYVRKLQGQLTSLQASNATGGSANVNDLNQFDNSNQMIRPKEREKLYSLSNKRRQNAQEDRNIFQNLARQGTHSNLSMMQAAAGTGSFSSKREDKKGRHSRKQSRDLDSMRKSRRASREFDKNQEKESKMMEAQGTGDSVPPQSFQPHNPPPVTGNFFNLSTLLNASNAATNAALTSRRESKRKSHRKTVSSGDVSHLNPNKKQGDMSEDDMKNLISSFKNGTGSRRASRKSKR